MQSEPLSWVSIPEGFLLRVEAQLGAKVANPFLQQQISSEAKLLPSPKFQELEMSGSSPSQGHVWRLIALAAVHRLLPPGFDCFSTLWGFDDNNNTSLCGRNLCLDFLSNLSFTVPPPAQQAMSLIAHQTICHVWGRFLLAVSGS